MAGGVAVEAQAAHAATLHAPASSRRAFISQGTLLAVRAPKGAGAPTLLPAMQRVVNAVGPGLVDPEAALYGNWIEWRTSNQSGRPLAMGDALRLRSEGSAISTHSSALALPHALGTGLSMNAAPYLNQARATYPRGVSELDAALRRLHLPYEDLEVGEVIIFVEGAGEAPPPRPRPTNQVDDRARPTPPYAVVGANLVPSPPAGHPRGSHLAQPTPVPPFSRTRGAHHRGQALWQERIGSLLLLVVVATRRDPEWVLGAIPTHHYGAEPVPPPPGV